MFAIPVWWWHYRMIINAAIPNCPTDTIELTTMALEIEPWKTKDLTIESEPTWRRN